MTIRVVPSPVLLMVLAFLSERPMHPYEMQRLVVERTKNAVMNIKRGSIYHAVERLRSAGFVEEQETSREGRRPERTVYRLTDEGRTELGVWMRDMLATPREEHPEFAAVLAFLPAVTPAEALAALRRRLVVLDGSIGRLDATLSSIGGRLPPVFVVEERYQVAMLRAERDWVAGRVRDLESGSLTWSAEELARWAEEYLADPLREGTT